MLPWLGMADTMRVMGGINGIIGILLLGWFRYPAKTRRKPARRTTKKTIFNDPFLAGIGLVGIASAIYQLLFLKITYTIFGPYHENFTLTASFAACMLCVS